MRHYARILAQLDKRDRAVLLPQHRATFRLSRAIAWGSLLQASRIAARALLQERMP